MKTKTPKTRKFTVQFDLQELDVISHHLEKSWPAMSAKLAKRATSWRKILAKENTR